MSTKAVESKTKLKLNHLRLSPEPPELAGFYVDSVWAALLSSPFGQPHLIPWPDIGPCGCLYKAVAIP